MFGIVRRRKQKKKSEPLQSKAQLRLSVKARSPASIDIGIDVGMPGKVAREIGGPSGAEPTRYGDWERKGRCIDF